MEKNGNDYYQNRISKSNVLYISGYHLVSSMIVKWMIDIINSLLTHNYLVKFLFISIFATTNCIFIKTFWEKNNNIYSESKTQKTNKSCKINGIVCKTIHFLSGELATWNTIFVCTHGIKLSDWIGINWLLSNLKNSPPKRTDEYCNKNRVFNMKYILNKLHYLYAFA